MKRSPPTCLYLLGASCRAMAQSARRALGDTSRIVACDLFGDRDLRSVCDEVHVIDGHSFPDGENGFRAWMNSHTANAADIWIYGGGLENAPALVSACSARHRLIGCAADVLQGVRDPVQVAACLRDAKLAYAPVSLVGAKRNPLDGPNLRWLRKPIASCAGHGITIVDEGEWTAIDGTYLQQWINGVLQSGTFVANGQTVSWLGTTQGYTIQDIRPSHPAAKSHPFRYAGSVGPLRLDGSLTQSSQAQQWKEIGGALTKRFGLRGLFGVDALVTADNKVVPVEINPRYTASMELIERSMDVSLIKLHLQAFSLLLPIHEEHKPATSDGIQRSKQVVYARQIMGLTQNSLDTWMRSWSEALPGCEFADLPFFKSRSQVKTFEMGQPVMTVLSCRTSLASEAAVPPSCG